jgi:hypothetical protein
MQTQLGRGRLGGMTVESLPEVLKYIGVLYNQPCLPIHWCLLLSLQLLLMLALFVVAVLAMRLHVALLLLLLLIPSTFRWIVYLTVPWKLRLD